MECMSMAPGTILFQLQPLGVIFLILLGGIGYLLALLAGQIDNLAHFAFFSHVYLPTLLNTPAPTVLPPSLMAKRNPCSIATG